MQEEEAKQYSIWTNVIIIKIHFRKVILPDKYNKHRLIGALKSV